MDKGSPAPWHENPKYADFVLRCSPYYVGPVFILSWSAVLTGVGVGCTVIGFSAMSRGVLVLNWADAVAIIGIMFTFLGLVFGVIGIILLAIWAVLRNNMDRVFLNPRFSPKKQRSALPYLTDFDRRLIAGINNICMLLFVITFTTFIPMLGIFFAPDFFGQILAAILVILLISMFVSLVIILRFYYQWTREIWKRAEDLAKEEQANRDDNTESSGAHTTSER